MRLVYLDEAGISNPVDEPYLVVAGVIVNADQDWRRLQQHLRSICRRLIPNIDDFGGEDFIFHAKDIWQGRKFFHHPSWTLQKRRELLLELARIPQKFHLPVVYTAINRALAEASCRNRRVSEPAPKDLTPIVHAAAFAEVAATVDQWMTANAPREVAMLVAEDTGKVKGWIKLIHAGYASDPFVSGSTVFTTQMIVDAVHFTKKEESQLLQIADVCAFLLKR